MVMLNWGQPLNGIIQIAFVVEDIRAAMPHYAERLNIGPWFHFPHFAFDWIKYRGAPSDLDIDLSLGFSGGMMFELIEQNNDVPSVYRDVVAQRGYGFHHWAISCMPDHYDGVMQDYIARGYDIALEGAVAVGARAAYVDTSADLGGMIELIEMTPEVEGLFSMIHAAHRDWDGRELVRVVS